MKALVTGTAGFVGSHLAERLIAEKHTVIGVDSFLDYYPRAQKENNIKKLSSNPSFTLIEDCLTKLDLNSILKDVDVIFHLAAQAGVRSSWGEQFVIYTTNNINATQRLLEAAKDSNIKRFVYASSSSVYGDTDKLPMQETDTPCPVSPYGVSKLAGEHLCNLYYKNYGVPTVSLRYFTVYGPRQRPDMAFHKFFRNAINGKTLEIYGNGDQTRDFTFISDIVAATFNAASAQNAVGKVFNLGGGSRTSLKAVLDTINELTHGAIKIEYKETQKGDVRHTYADTSLARNILKFNPQVGVKEGLSQEYQWIKDFYKQS